MVINGLSPGLPIPEREPAANIEQEKLEQQAKLHKESLEKEALKSEIQKQEQKKEIHQDEFSQHALNDYSLKELLFLMTSKGNSATIEKLAKLLKKEKEYLNNGK